MEAAAGRLMLDVTWEWIGIDAAALDVSNTVAVSEGEEHDLLAPVGEYERWAAVAASSSELDPEEAGALRSVAPRLLELRGPIRDVLFATAAGDPPPSSAVAALNRHSRACPAWVELGADGKLREQVQGSAADRLLAKYARSTLELAAEGRQSLRVCPAPSCGMFFRPGRVDQHWCSKQCGTRARVAKHYRAHRA